MDDPRKKNLRLIIKETEFASLKKVLREKAILSFVNVLHGPPVEQGHPKISLPRHCPMG
jgi:hypothetical protein